MNAVIEPLSAHEAMLAARCADDGLVVGLMRPDQAKNVRVVIDRLRFAARLVGWGLEGQSLLRRRGINANFSCEHNEPMYLVNRIGFEARLLEFAEEPDGPHHHARAEVEAHCCAFDLSDGQDVGNVRGRFVGASFALTDIVTSDEAMRQLKSAVGRDADDASEALLSIWESLERAPKR